jgi:Flp pilus assembly pilin Flp
MGTMRHIVQNLWNDQSGQDMIEYAMMAALVAVGSAVLLPMEVSSALSHIYARVNSCMTRFGNNGG